MRYRLLLLPLLVGDHSLGAHAQYYPYPGNYAPGYSAPGYYYRPPPPLYYSWPGHPPPDANAPPYDNAPPVSSSANCGTSEQFKPCAR
jgi:hypothetical protein